MEYGNNKNKLGQTIEDGERYATGIRSVVGLTWNKKLNSLFGETVVNFLHNHAPQFYSDGKYRSASGGVYDD